MSFKMLIRRQKLWLRDSPDYHKTKKWLEDNKIEYEEKKDVYYVTTSHFAIKDKKDYQKYQLDYLKQIEDIRAFTGYTDLQDLLMHNKQYVFLVLKDISRSTLCYLRHPGNDNNVLRVIKWTSDTTIGQWSVYCENVVVNNEYCASILLFYFADVRDRALFRLLWDCKPIKAIVETKKNIRVKYMLKGIKRTSKSFWIA